MKFNNFSQRSADNNLISLIIDIFVLILSFGLSGLVLFRNLELLVTDMNLLIFTVVYGSLVIFFFTVFEMYSSIIIGYKPSMVTIILTSLYTLAITEFVSLVFLHDGEHLLFILIGAILSALLLLFWRYCRHLYFLSPVSGV